MPFARNLLVVGAAAAALLLSAGCSRKTDSSTDPSTASISGNQDATPANPAPQTPGKANQAGATDPLHPIVELQTSKGKIVLELDASEAPLTVENFLKYVESKHYDQTIFHQVLKDYVIMGGGYTEDLSEKSARGTLRNEAQKSRLKNTAGTIAMVRKPDSQDSAVCQFFINVADNPNLDYRGPNAEEYGYCPFGKVISGMDVVKKIAEVEVTDKAVDVPGKTDKAEFERLPKQAVVIQSARSLRAPNRELVSQNASADSVRTK